MSSNFFPIWLGVLIVVHLAALPIRTMRGRKTLSVEDFMSTGFAIGGLVSLAKVLIKLKAQSTLQAELDFDGSIGLFLGCTAGIYFALKDVYIKLF